MFAAGAIGGVAAAECSVSDVVTRTHGRGSVTRTHGVRDQAHYAASQRLVAVRVAGSSSGSDDDWDVACAAPLHDAPLPSAEHAVTLPQARRRGGGGVGSGCGGGRGRGLRAARGCLGGGAET